MSDKIDFQEALKGLSTTLRKAKDGELYVALTSDLELTVQIGETDDLVRVLHPTSVMTLLERLNAEIRVPSIGDRVIGSSSSVWYTTAISHSVPRICKKKPKPEYRNLEIGEPVMPGDRLFNRHGESLGKAYNHYRRGTANVQGHSGPLYAREAWNRDEYASQQKEWVEFHNLKVGDTVKVCCKAVDSRDGWNNTWISVMDDAVGQECQVTEINHNIRLKIPDEGSLGFPFYVLQVVTKPEIAGISPHTIVLDDPKNPELKYREFRTPQEVLSWVREHGHIVVKDNGDWCSVLGATKVDKTEFQPDGVSTRDYVYTWKSVINGTPFGVAELA